MRSLTSRSALLRRVWTRLISSRARPSCSSAGVMVVSSTTVTSPSASATRPGRGSRRNTKSSAVSTWPSTSTSPPSRIARSAAASSGLDRVGDDLHLLAQALAEDLEVGLGREADQGRVVVGELDGLDVELGLDVGREPADRLADGRIAAGHGQARERATHADPLALAQAQTQADDALDDRDLGLELRVDQRRVDDRERLEVDLNRRLRPDRARRRRSAAGTGTRKRTA